MRVHSPSLCSRGVQLPNGTLKSEARAAPLLGALLGGFTVARAAGLRQPGEQDNVGGELFVREKDAKVRREEKQTEKNAPRGGSS